MLERDQDEHGKAREGKTDNEAADRVPKAALREGSGDDNERGNDQAQ